MQMLVSKGYNPCGHRHFDRLFKAWIETNHYMLNNMNGHKVPWQYNERACVSVFSAAIWRHQLGIAMEEYSTEKKRTPMPFSNRYRGRQDLYFSIGSHEYIAESKIFRPGITIRKADPWSPIRARLKSARHDVDSSITSARRLVLCFVSPLIRQSHHISATSLVENWLKRVTSNAAALHIAHAWIFPDSTRTFSVTGEHMLPGILLLARRTS